MSNGSMPRACVARWGALAIAVTACAAGEDLGARGNGAGGAGNRDAATDQSSPDAPAGGVSGGGAGGTGGSATEAGVFPTGGTAGAAGSSGAGGAPSDSGAGAAGDSASPGGAAGADATGGVGAIGGTGGTGGTAGTAGGAGGAGGTAGAGGTTACAPPLTDCGGACVDTAADVAHCGGCDSACTAPPNATPVCAGSCDFSCSAGFVRIGSACATFGGAFATNGASCPVASCRTANPFTGDCSCPAGFAPSGPMEMLDDRACPSNNPPFGWQSVFFCQSGAPAATPDFGGSYHREGAACRVGNPLAAGACACPGGTTSIEMPVDHACWNDTHIGLCWGAAAPLATFGGAYELADVTYGCVAPNPATGACSCPAGTAPIVIRSIYGPGNAGCRATGAFGANLYLCHAP